MGDTPAKRPRGRPPIPEEVQRRRLVTAAIRVFAEKPFEGARIADIVREARMSSRSFYQFFESKEDVVVEVGCKSANTQVENPECSDGLDNDSDGYVDLLDPQCGLASGTIEFAPRKSCGLLGIEALPLLGLLAWRRRRSRP